MGCRPGAVVARALPWLLCRGRSACLPALTHAPSHAGIVTATPPPRHTFGPPISVDVKIKFAHSSLRRAATPEVVQSVVLKITTYRGLVVIDEDSMRLSEL